MLDLSEDIVSVFCVGICTHTKSDERKEEGEEMGEGQDGTDHLKCGTKVLYYLTD